MRNYWIIGDIHGEITLLDRLLESIIRFHPDQVVFVGDYIDRGAYSRNVVDRIMSLEGEVTALMGNHELMMLNAMDNLGYGYNPTELWYYNGGEATLLSFGFSSFFSFQSDMDPRYQEFFRNLKMSHVIDLIPGLKILVTHAGISPAIPVADQISIDNYDELNRYMFDNHVDLGDSFLWVRDAFFASPPRLWEGYLVVHGHTPVGKLHQFTSSDGPDQFVFVDHDLSLRKESPSGKIVSIDIDSGSVMSGRLSGLGFFVEDDDMDHPSVRMRSMTVSGEDIFPRDLGPVSGYSGI
jgi:serine/threonine protein phosphatase 1